VRRADNLEQYKWKTGFYT